MKNIFRGTIIFMLLILAVVTQIAAQPRVSLLTCGAGDEVYSLFGHTALRYSDEASGEDIVFNYGVFDFNAPNFVWRFVLGQTDYILACNDYRRFCEEYAVRGSSVTEQVLNLDSLQVQRLVTALAVNARPENRVYRYNYFFNNCTTKARDAALSVVDGAVQYDSLSPMHGQTYRDIVHHFTAEHPWTTFGIDLLLGAPADEVAGTNAQFIPSVLMSDLASAYIDTPDGRVPLVAEERDILPQAENGPLARNNLTPFNVSLLLLLFTFVVMLCERRAKRTFWGWDILLMGLQGLSGLLLAFMALFSVHPTVNENYLLIFLNPLPLLLLPILIYRIMKGRSPIVVARVQIFMVAAFFVAAFFVRQTFPPAVFVCAAALLVRSWFHINKNRICALD